MRRFLLRSVVISTLLFTSHSPIANIRADEPASKGTIGVSLLTLTNPFFKVIGDNITRVAARAGLRA